MTNSIFDVAIIGSGPGGYTTAIRAARAGLTTALIEKANIGGVCLNAGCIPTKTLIALAKKFKRTNTSLSTETSNANNQFLDVSNFYKQKNRIINQFAAGINFLLKQAGVQIIKGHARIKNNQLIEISTPEQNTFEIQSKTIVVATGSRPKDLPSIPWVEQKILSSNEALNHEKIPNHIAIIGGGYIGCEFAAYFNSLGSHVSIIEALPGILPNHDQEISQMLTRVFHRKGIDIITNTTVTRAQIDNQIKLLLNNSTQLCFDLVVICVGRIPNTQDIGLENVGIETSNGYIKTGKFMETSVKNIFAIGDVTGKMTLAHTAYTQGKYAVAGILKLLNKHGKESNFYNSLPDEPNYDSIPSVVFSDPEIASVGLTTERAKSLSIDPRISRFPLTASAKAVIDGNTEGFIKILADPVSLRIIGAHIVGENASELISQMAIAIQNKLTAFDLAQVTWPHPTTSEIISESIEGLIDKPIHFIPK